LFDDDIDRFWVSSGYADCDWGKSICGRDYGEDMKDNKENHKLKLIGVPNATFEVIRYNTWTGDHSNDDDVTSQNNILKIPVGEFSVDDDHPSLTWDGADVLLIIKRK
jgi:hypothetical protein